jgi:lipopolysaccharide/colanic/teichoic acid biosynthesis glycosyltransferase
MVVVDLVLLAGSVVLSSMILFGTPWPWDAPQVGPQVLPMLGFVMLAALGASTVVLPMASPGVPRPSYGRGMAVVMITLSAVALMVLATRIYFSRSLLLATMGIWAITVVIHRLVRRRRPWIEPMVVFSSDQEMVIELQNAPHSDVREVVDPTSNPDQRPLDPGITLVVDMAVAQSPEVAKLVSGHDLAGRVVKPLASVYEEHTERVPLTRLVEDWQMTTTLHRVRNWLWGKRVFDLSAVVLTLPVWMFLAVAVALAVRVSSPGPVLFRQTRVGRGGQPFVMYKFRTMRVDAESDGPRFAEVNDPRLVRGGRVLRRYRLDEIPQLWNVVIGDMSLVGPRAEQAPFVDEFSREIPFYSLRHLLRPGVTGWAQINATYAADLDSTVRKLTYDLYYIKHVSPILDLRILWSSVWTVLTGSGSR